mmetsp:Transcript_3321/g.7847  ORF Transcript_3321/g.7847 Transcript_3321/m.7847 type:complete len:204 (-) Transcript_3321:840-1451(-)
MLALVPACLVNLHDLLQEFLLVLILLLRVVTARVEPLLQLGYLLLFLLDVSFQGSETLLHSLHLASAYSARFFEASLNVFHGLLFLLGVLNKKQIRPFQGCKDVQQLCRLLEVHGHFFSAGDLLVLVRIRLSRGVFLFYSSLSGLQLLFSLLRRFFQLSLWSSAAASDLFGSLFRHLLLRCGKLFLHLGLGKMHPLVDPSLFA